MQRVITWKKAKQMRKGHGVSLVLLCMEIVAISLPIKFSKKSIYTDMVQRHGHGHGYRKINVKKKNREPKKIRETYTKDPPSSGYKC